MILFLCICANQMNFVYYGELPLAIDFIMFFGNEERSQQREKTLKRTQYCSFSPFRFVYLKRSNYWCGFRLVVSYFPTVFPFLFVVFVGWLSLCTFSLYLRCFFRSNKPQATRFQFFLFLLVFCTVNFWPTTHLFARIKRCTRAQKINRKIRMSKQPSRQ